MGDVIYLHDYSPYKDARTERDVNEQMLFYAVFGMTPRLGHWYMLEIQHREWAKQIRLARLLDAHIVKREPPTSAI